jgi:hypothetical protein
MPTTRGAVGIGSGARRTRRWSVSALVGIASRASTRAPVSALTAVATTRCAVASRVVRRACGARKGQGSAKVPRGHAASRQKKRRTRTSSQTG